MYRATALLLGIAALAVTSVGADARDGCGRGMFYDGYGCAPEGYRQPRYVPEPRYYGGHQYRQPQYDRAPRPTVGRNGSISCNNPNYTFQDGACKPYSGR